MGEYSRVTQVLVTRGNSKQGGSKIKTKESRYFFTLFWCFLLLSPTVCGTASAAGPGEAPHKATIAMVFEPDTLKIQRPARYSVTPAPINNNIFERLVDLTPDGKCVPGIASWKVSPDGKIVNLRHCARMSSLHNGDPLTTKDVEFSHTRAFKTNPTHQRAMRNLDKFEIIDDYRCRFIFKVPDVPFIPTRSLTIVSKSYFDKVGENEFVAKPVGTGPCPGELGYDPDLKPYTYDPKKAKELLTQAGYSKGFEMPLYYFIGRVTGRRRQLKQWRSICPLSASVPEFRE